MKTAPTQVHCVDLESSVGSTKLVMSSTCLKDVELVDCISTVLLNCVLTNDENIYEPLLYRLAAYSRHSVSLIDPVSSHK